MTPGPSVRTDRGARHPNVVLILLAVLWLALWGAIAHTITDVWLN